MPHLHTQPHGHDVTISAWILRRFPSDSPRGWQWKALVHKHRKMNLWIQPGGHVEHTERPLLTSSTRKLATTLTS